MIEAPSEARRLVICYGNPLRRDDGLGWEVAARLTDRLPELATTTVLSVHQLTPELADEIGRASVVVFVDAHAGGQPGELLCRALAPDSAQAASFSHDVDAEALLSLTHALSGVCPPAVMLSVGGGDFGYGVGLSAAVAAAVQAVVDRVDVILRDGGLVMSASGAGREGTGRCTK